LEQRQRLPLALAHLEAQLSAQVQQARLVRYRHERLMLAQRSNGLHAKKCADCFSHMLLLVALL
jgi:hypothetical protein